jgi:hypothetical protein
VHQAVVAPAEQDEVVEARLAAVCPVAEVMGIDEARSFTAGEATAAIAAAQRSPQGRRHRPRLPADRERLVVRLLTRASEESQVSLRAVSAASAGPSATSQPPSAGSERAAAST